MFTYIIFLALVISSSSTASSTSQSTQVRHATGTAHAAELGEVNVAETTLVAAGTAEATEVVGIVILSSLILLVLIHPLRILLANRQSPILPRFTRCRPYLVKISLEEVDLLGVFKKTRPVLELQLLLAQNKLDLTVGVVHLAVLRVDLAEQVKGNRVCDALARGAGEGDIVGGQTQLGLLLRDIGSLQVHVEVVALGLRVGGTLGPGN